MRKSLRLGPARHADLSYADARGGTWHIEPMTRSTGPRGRVLARNAVINLFGQGLPLAIGVVTAPAVIRGLGADRYGVLAMAGC